MIEKEESPSRADITIGAGVTLCHPSDRYPFTLIGKEYDSRGMVRYLIVQQDSVSYQGGTSEYIYMRNESGTVYILRWNAKSKCWCNQGGTPFRLGIRQLYRAPEI